MKKLAILTIARPAFALALFAMPVFAQDDTVIDEIQVTATRRPASVGEVSAAVTLIDQAKIEAAKLATDALLAEPGVFLQQTTPGQGAAIVRGLKGSEVLHVVDGLRMNNAIFRNAPTQYLALVAPGTVERIEVLRGAPASLYGSDAVGGVVQVLSRVPGADGAGTLATAAAGIDTADRARRVRASLESGNGRVAGLVSGEYLETGHRRVGGGARIVPSAYTSKGARVAFALMPDDASSWLFDLQYAQQPATPRVDELVPGFGQAQPASAEFLFAPNERSFAHVRHTRTNGLWAADWTIDAGWQRIVDDRVSRDFGSPLRQHEDNSSDLFGLAVSAVGTAGAGDWIAGVEWYHDRVASLRIEEDLASGRRTAVQARFPDGSTVDQAALFGNLSRHIAPRHRLSGGLRFSSVRVDLPAVQTIPATVVRQEDISADAGWVFDATAQTQIVANLGYGFRAPNVFDLGTLGVRPGNRFNVPNPDLDSERILQFDAGIRHRSSRWQAEVMLFTLHYSDRITSVLTGGTTPGGRDIVQSQNVNSADIRGVESLLRIAVTADIAAEVVANYLHGEQAEPGGNGVPADRIPPFNGRLSLRWQISDAWMIEPSLRFAGVQDRLSPRDVRDVRINPAGTPGWLTLNLGAEWQAAAHWRLTGGIDNLLDQRYRTHGSGIDAGGRSLLLNVHYRR